MKLPYAIALVFIGTCKGYNPQLDRVLCVVNYNWAYYDSIPIIRKMYEPFFPNMVFYGPQQHPAVHYIDHFKGYFGYKVLIDAMTRYPDYDGYFFMNDDCMINIKNFRTFDCNKIWFVYPNIVEFSDKLARHSWMWWKSHWGLSALRKSCAELSTPFVQQVENHIGKGNTCWMWSDVVYIPRRHTEAYKAIASVFLKHELFLEIATPNICAYLDSPKDWEILNSLYLWGKDREKLYNKYTHAHHFIHPVKLSNQRHVNWVFQQLAKQYES